MIVIGTDTHKRTHTCGAVDAATGRLAGELTAAAREPGFRELLAWGRGLGGERIWAIEDCRHVSGPLERFLVASGERVVRVPPRLTGQSRRGGRTAGKSDPIDALAVARAALREGPETLPAAHLDEEALRVKLLLDHREDLVRARAEDQCRLRWHLHNLWPGLEIPAGALDRMRLARPPGKEALPRRAGHQGPDRPRAASPRSAAAPAGPPGSSARSRALVKAQAPELLALEGCGALTAAKLIAETAGAGRLRLRREVRPPGRRRPDPRLLGHAHTATASTAAATDCSTAPSTASR